LHGQTEQERQGKKTNVAQYTSWVFSKCWKLSYAKQMAYMTS